MWPQSVFIFVSTSLPGSHPNIVSRKVLLPCLSKTGKGTSVLSVLPLAYDKVVSGMLHHTLPHDVSSRSTSLHASIHLSILCAHKLAALHKVCLGAQFSKEFLAQTVEAKRLAELYEHTL